jgi:nucleoside-diphosphate-sugar epimerase
MPDLVGQPRSPKRSETIGDSDPVNGYDLSAPLILTRLRGLRVAVTGGSGFVGSHLVRTLVQFGAQVTALYPEPTAPRLQDLESIERVVFDLQNPDSVVTSLSEARPEIVFHLAAYGVQRRDRDLTKAVLTNVSGAAAVVEGAAQAGTRIVVHIGTSAEYGGLAEPIPEDAEIRPAGIYAATKAAGTIVARARARELGVRWLGLRPFVTFGPGEDRDKLVPYVITRALGGEPVITTGGTQIRDFVYVEDLVLGVAMAPFCDLADGEILNLGTGVGTSVGEIIDLIARTIGRADLRIGARNLSVDDVPRQVADVTKQRRLLPAWRPTTSLDEGIRRTIAWYSRLTDSH